MSTKSYLRAAGVLSGVLFAASISNFAMAQEAQTCAERVDGKVAWNQEGNAEWINTNVERLCLNAHRVDARIACFADGIAAHNNWGKAINDCTEGINVDAVYAPRASYKWDGSIWTEYNLAGGATFAFEEQGRDEWSVYMYDASRDVHLQLDLWRKKILYAAGSDPKVDLYDIIAAK